MDIMNNSYNKIYFKHNFNQLDDFKPESLFFFLSSYIEDIKNIEIVIKKFNPNDSMKFHIDDCQIVKIKKIEHNLENYVHLKGNKYLYFKKRPKFTAVFYFNNENVIGGNLIFADKTEIKPISKTGVIFDSREAHMVSKIKEGIRNSVIVKIF